MFRFSKAKKKKLQEAAVNKFFASWLRGWCDGIVRGLVPKEPKHRRLRGDWSLKNLDNMADSSEKVHFTSICNVLPCELRLFWYSTGVLNRHLANKLPTCCQQLADKRPTFGQHSADCWQNIFVKGGKRQSADCRPTVGRQFFWGSCSSLFPITQYVQNLKVIHKYGTSCWALK